ncbi:MAG: hypothetical protein LBU89_00735 [Fibromonadaceae bacterium]|jgi:hypothetical protein|nr:hypothetical protein [Fibromonadaceae bacterium]
MSDKRDFSKTTTITICTAELQQQQMCLGYKSGYLYKCKYRGSGDGFLLCKRSMGGKNGKSYS